MTILAGVLLLIASIIHCWWSGNAKAGPGNAAEAFYRHAKGILFFQILLLATALIIFWLSKGFVAALVAAGIYFFVLPLIVLPILAKIGLVQ